MRIATCKYYHRNLQHDGHLESNKRTIACTIELHCCANIRSANQALNAKYLYEGKKSIKNENRYNRFITLSNMYRLIDLIWFAFFFLLAKKNTTISCHANTKYVYKCNVHAQIANYVPIYKSINFHLLASQNGSQTVHDEIRTNIEIGLKSHVSII